MNFKKLLVILAAVMLLMGLTVTASAAEVSADTAPAAAEDCRNSRLELLEARLTELVSAGTIPRPRPMPCWHGSQSAWQAVTVRAVTIRVSATAPAAAIRAYVTEPAQALAAAPPATVRAAFRAVAWAAADGLAK